MTEVTVERRNYPILGSKGASIDWQLVVDHGGQAYKNHRQSVERLAERGGLSWVELYAVLNNQQWQKIDENEAIIACRSIEAKYLSAVTEPASADTLARLQRERDQAVEALREMQEQLAKAQSPQWFYHPDYTESCQFGPWDVIEHYDLKPGKHVVEIQTARPLPSIWSVVHVLTNAEKDEMETDDAWMVQDFTTEAEARAALAAIEGAEHD